ncbi:uncharacterized protein LOC125775613 [Bactrocera dorsalis]|uniref:Uncharacterized protein LOC125775613 n=1 Tax=Bactrocera dorsalis TaxID=27457 RepID=A0ABM3IZ08_BACDO|nr:uncharacterized protein LOC125775613 [Bactrocera dorsalis]
MEQQKTVRECKVLIRKIHQSVCRMTGEDVDNVQTEIASTLPLNTLAAALEMDEKLKCDEFAATTKQFILRIKGTSDSVHDVYLRLPACDKYSNTTTHLYTLTPTHIFWLFFVYLNTMKKVCFIF